ncbi:Aquaporin-9 [Ceratocystis fimbriata CBS 114723]|uniref:Aquaporin-9 n=1 Tax=Ceratocystis fimbriata CBS 114723 TaxID=1035309 RepID=A0A2C5WUR7_9PEZI|nr:Aquaporin-9 [Ceratocystis fimbriata CBS 114723]
MAPPPTSPKSIPAAHDEKLSPTDSQDTHIQHKPSNTDPIYNEPSPAGNAIWPRIRQRYQDCFAEFLGTFVIVLFGDSVVAQSVLSDSAAGGYISINFGWALAVAFGIFASGKSGAHLNPAVTVALAVFRGFSWRKVPGYIASQMLGGFLGALIMYANYVSAIDNFEGRGVRTVGGETSTAGLFCTYPQPFLNKAGQMFSEALGSAVLMAGILAVTDRGNIGGVVALPIAVGLLVFAIGLCFGWETGYAINMARDFMPRLASYMLGYGSAVWSAGNYYFWVPIVSPFLGTLLGAFVYDLLIFDGESPVNTPYMGMAGLFSREPKKPKADIEAAPTQFSSPAPGKISPPVLPNKVPSSAGSSKDEGTLGHLSDQPSPDMEVQTPETMWSGATFSAHPPHAHLR